MNFNIGKTADAGSLSMLRNEALSYFIAPDANLSSPASILSGDRGMGETGNQPAYSSISQKSAVLVNLSSEWSTFPSNNIHGTQADILLGDGSVNLASTQILQNQLKVAAENYGTNVNRFLFPQ